MRYLALIGMLLLCSCVTAEDSGYVRARGRTNAEHLRLTLAQCQGEAAATPSDVYVSGPGWAGFAGSLMVRAAQQDTFTSACMARNGYVMARPAPQPQQ